MKIKNDTVSVDCGEEEAIICSYPELLNARRREKTVSQCYREYIEEAIKLGLVESIVPELEIRRYFKKEGNISLETAFLLGVTILGEIEAEIYILQLAENNISHHIMNIMTGKSQRARDAELKSAFKKITKMEKKTTLVFSTDQGKDIKLTRKYKDGNVIYKGRKPGDISDSTVKEKDVINFIKYGGRVRSTRKDIPSTPYGIGSISKKAGKIIGLIEIEEKTHNRIIILGTDHII